MDDNVKTSKLEEQFETFNKEQAWQKIFIVSFKAKKF